MTYSDIDGMDYDEESRDFYIIRANGTVNLYNRDQEPELFELMKRFVDDGQIDYNEIHHLTDEERFQESFRQEYREKYGEEFEEWNW